MSDLTAKVETWYAAAKEVWETGPWWKKALVAGALLVLGGVMVLLYVAGSRQAPAPTPAQDVIADRAGEAAAQGDVVAAKVDEAVTESRDALADTIAIDAVAVQLEDEKAAVTSDAQRVRGELDSADDFDQLADAWKDLGGT